MGLPATQLERACHAFQVDAPALADHNVVPFASLHVRGHIRWGLHPQRFWKEHWVCEDEAADLVLSRQVNLVILAQASNPRQH